jgi:hypothetical protein
MAQKDAKQKSLGRVIILSAAAIVGSAAATVYIEEKSRLKTVELHHRQEIVHALRKDYTLMTYDEAFGKGDTNGQGYEAKCLKNGMKFSAVPLDKVRIS